MSSFEKIEFMFSGDPGELVCLWYWDWAHGRDVAGVVMDNGSVQVKTYDDNGEENGTEIITVLDFFGRIKTSLDLRDDEYKPKHD